MVVSYRQQLCQWIPVTLFVLFLGAVFGSSAEASVWYVNNVEGRDTNTGLNKDPSANGSGPFRTIRRAMKAAKQGDTVHLVNTGRPYYEQVSISGSSHSGFEGRPFRLVGNGSVISGLVPVDSDNWKAIKTGIYKYPAKNGRFGQLYRRGRPLPFQKVDKNQIDQLKPMHWTILNGFFYLRTENDMLPSVFHFEQTYHTTGITLYNVHDVVVQDVVVQGFSFDGVNAFDGVSKSSIVGVNSRGNGRSGVSVGGDSELKIEGSIVGDNIVAQVRTEVLGKAQIVDSNVLDFSHGVRLDQKGGKITETKTPEK